MNYRAMGFAKGHDKAPYIAHSFTDINSAHEYCQRRNDHSAGRIGKPNYLQAATQYWVEEIS